MKSAHDEMKERTELLETVFDLVSEGIFLLDDRLNYVLINPASGRIMGHDPREWTGKQAGVFVHPDDRSTGREAFVNALKGESSEMEIRVAGKEGGYRQLRIRLSPFNWRGRRHVLGVVTDLTSQKQAEETLKKRERELKANNRELQEMNSALNVLLNRREEDRKGVEEKILFNIRQMVIPFLGKLKQTRTSVSQEAYLEILEANLGEITSPFGHYLSVNYFGLTPAEIHVANLIRQGKSTKDIALLLNLSARTIDVHRRNLRDKLGITNKKVNLRTYLMALA
jgi:PAS domain S-box-containing protein